MQKKTPLALSREFSEILDQLERTDDSAFITGRAGTGKSTLLQLFRNTTRKRVAVLAPTGIAAINVKGQTIHSFFSFPPRMINASEIKKKPNHRMYKNLDAIIIDEISMVRADVMDNIDLFLRKNRNIDKPFGGVQMILFGDLFQLPPVVASAFEKQLFRERYESPYFFSSKIFQSGFLCPMWELGRVYRQEEKRFVNLLDNIRLHQFDYDDLEDLNTRYVPVPENKEFYITLCSRNDIAERINKNELEKLDCPLHQYKATVTGEFQSRLFPTDLFLHIRKGAQVMFVKNDPQKRFVNGTIGKVKECTDELIKVSIYNHFKEEYENIEIEKLEWDILKYRSDPENPRKIDTEILGTFTQYPIKLAWAITIHKSQGKTFDRVIIDLGGGAFEHGQTYVALSRCRTLEGIILKKPIRPKDIMVDDKVQEYLSNARYHS